VTWLLVAAGAVVALGAGVATGARGGRTTALGALVALVFTPFLADPLPGPAAVAYRIVAGALAAFLLLVAARRAGSLSESALGLPATLAAGGAAFVAGLGATAVGLPAFGPTGALAAGLAGFAMALPSVIRARDALRLGTGLVVLLDAALLLRSGLVGTPPALETLVAGMALVVLAATVATLVAAAATVSRDAAIPGPALERRRPAP
jgi:hypothetical protein